MHLRWVLPVLATVALAACDGSTGVESIDATDTETTTEITATAGHEPSTPPADGEASAEAPGNDESVDDESPDDKSGADESLVTNAEDFDSTGSTTVPVDEILAELEANGFCDPVDIEGNGDVGNTTAMQFVVDATPQPPCYGAPDDRLDLAWSDLEAVAPVDYLDDISLLAGYEACEGCDTLAFVTALDEGAFFLMAIDVTAAQDDPDELLLTLLHELSHIFTQDPTTQLDVGAAPEACTTYHNGNGCLSESSYLWDWISRFWDAGVLEAFEQGDADQDGGEDRCELGGAYTGSYGASSPEEDFAEVFAAYVFAVEFDGELDEKLAFFDEYDEFGRIRDRAEELGLTGLDNSFERCG